MAESTSSPPSSPPEISFTATINTTFVPHVPLSPYPFTGTKLSSLESLPLEIRHMIYHHLGYPTTLARQMPTSRFGGPANKIPVRSNYHFTSREGSHDQRSLQTPLRPLVKARPELALLRVCRKVSDDCYRLLYGDSAMSFSFALAKPVYGSNLHAGAVARSLERKNSSGEKKKKNKGKRDASEKKDRVVISILPMFLTSRAISFLTHVTLGSYNAHRARKIAQISSAEWEDELYVVWGGDGYVTNVKGKVAKRMNSKPTTWEDLVASTIFVGKNCPSLKVLGLHFHDNDLSHGDLGPMDALLDALEDVAMMCRGLNRIIFGRDRTPWDSAQLPVISKDVSLADMRDGMALRGKMVRDGLAKIAVGMFPSTPKRLATSPLFTDTGTEKVALKDSDDWRRAFGGGASPGFRPK